MAATAVPVVGSFGGGAEDIDELFGDIDWATANFTELEAKWRAELDTIEKENVKILLESSEKGQVILPAINEAINDITQMEGLFVDYNRQLKIMGREISQIAEANQALEIQARNQSALLSELVKILKSVDVPSDLLQVLGVPNFVSDQSQITTLNLAAQALYSVLETKFDRGIKDIRAVAERLQKYRTVMDKFEDGLLQHLVSLLRIDQKRNNQFAHLNASLLPFAPLIQLLCAHAPQKFMNFRMAYESFSKGVLSREMSETAEHFKAHNLVNKTPDEKPSCTTISLIFLLSSNRPSSSIGPIRFARGKDFRGHAAFGDARLPSLNAQDKLLPEQLFEYMLLLIVQVSSDAFDQVASLFFPSESPDSIVKVGQTLDAIFANMQDLLISAIANPLIKADKLSTFALLAVTERRLPEMADELPAMGETLRRLQAYCSSIANDYIKAQVDAIQESRFSAKKRTGIFPFVAIFPKFVTVLEKSIEGSSPTGISRTSVNHAYQLLSNAIFASLNALAVQANQTDDEKDNLNASIMTVQNTYYLLEIMTSMNNPAIEPVLKQAKAEFDENNKGYANLSMSRVLGRIPEFFEAIRKLLQSSSPDEVSYHSSYDKTAARRFLSSISPKDIRRNVESIRERVLKHYKGGSKDDMVVTLVWSGLQECACAKIKEYTEIIYKVYPGTDISLPVSPEDLAAWFKDATRIK